MKICSVILVFSALNATAAADPQITSWFTLDSGKFAQIYRSDADKISGRTETCSDGPMSPAALTAK